MSCYVHPCNCMCNYQLVELKYAVRVVCLDAENLQLATNFLKNFRT